MTITSRVQKQFFAAATPASEELIRLPPTVVTRYANNEQLSAAAKSKRASRPRRRTNLWTVEEHERFLYGLEQFSLGPWKEIAAIVGTKTTRQTMTHAQKYRQKIERHQQRNGTKMPVLTDKVSASKSDCSGEANDQMMEAFHWFEMSSTTTPVPNTASSLQVTGYDPALNVPKIQSLVGGIDPLLVDPFPEDLWYIL